MQCQGIMAIAELRAIDFLHTHTHARARAHTHTHTHTHAHKYEENKIFEKN